MKFLYLFFAIIIAGLLLLIILQKTEVEAGTIEGRVIIGPTCPVLKDIPDPACSDKPYATELELRDENRNRVVKRFSSNENGLFQVSIQPGTYTIQSVQRTNPFPRCGSSTSIVLNAQATAHVDVLCDTGIR